MQALHFNVKLLKGFEKDFQKEVDSKKAKRIIRALLQAS